MNASALALTICLSAALAGPVAAQTSRHADPLNDAPRMSIRYDDLDLARAPGAAVMLQRIKNAAGAACGPQPSTVLSVGDVRRYASCVRTNMDAAVKAVNAPRVTAFYRAQAPLTVVAAR
ncbi:MAG TPA: UrcA family protein [Phenylobacterium sp.]|jgi:UrcA family protein